MGGLTLTPVTSLVTSTDASVLSGNLETNKLYILAGSPETNDLLFQELESLATKRTITADDRNYVITKKETDIAYCYTLGISGSSTGVSAIIVLNKADKSVTRC